MANIKKGAGVVVAADALQTMAALDGALLVSHRMSMSVIEAAQGSGLPAGETQKLYVELSSGIRSVVEGRGHMVAAVRRMTVIKNASNIRMEDYGCPDGFSATAASAPIAVRSELV